MLEIKILREHTWSHRSHGPPDQLDTERVCGRHGLDLGHHLRRHPAQETLSIPWPRQAWLSAPQPTCWGVSERALVSVDHDAKHRISMFKYAKADLGCAAM